MGIVYKARQKSLNRWVAIKILAPERVGEDEFAERFAREATVLAKLSHPNVVTIYDFGEAEGLFYIVMEFVDGVNLRDLLSDGKLEPERALAIIPSICEALEYAHKNGIVHRDIKPENILLDRAGRVKVADFGIARILGTANEPASREYDGECTRSVVGTKGYRAPEQVASPRHADSRADIYSLGVVLYEMLTGTRPDKEVVAPSHKVQIDVRLDEIVLRAMEKNPELRYQQVSEVRTMCETIASTPPPTGEAAVPLIITGSAPVIPRPKTFWQMLKSRLWPPMVVRRNNQRIINWPAVAARGIRGLLLLIPIAAIFILGGIRSHESGWIAWFGIAWLGFGLLFLSTVLAIRVMRGFSRPLNELPDLDNPVNAGSPRQIPSVEKRGVADFQSAEKSMASHFSRTAIVGVLCLLATLVIASFSFVGNLRGGEVAQNDLTPMTGGLILLGQIFWTVLGWIAVVQIRRSAGKLRGMGLAVLLGMLVPLLALDLCVIWNLGARSMMVFTSWQAPAISNYVVHSASDSNKTFTLIHQLNAYNWILGIEWNVFRWTILAVVILVNWLIIRTVWRAVNNGVAPVARQAWQSPTSGWGHFIGYLQGITFTSPLAYKFANFSALGFLCFLGFMPLPGWKGFFGFSGFFGLIGLSTLIEMVSRSKARHSGSINKQPPSALELNRWQGVSLLIGVILLSVAALVVVLKQVISH